MSFNLNYDNQKWKSLLPPVNSNFALPVNYSIALVNSFEGGWKLFGVNTENNNIRSSDFSKNICFFFLYLGVIADLYYSFRKLDLMDWE